MAQRCANFRYHHDGNTALTRNLCACSIRQHCDSACFTSSNSKGCTVNFGPGHTHEDIPRSNVFGGERNPGDFDVIKDIGGRKS